MRCAVLRCAVLRCAVLRCAVLGSQPISLPCLLRLLRCRDCRIYKNKQVLGQIFNLGALARELAGLVEDLAVINREGFILREWGARRDGPHSNSLWSEKQAQQCWRRL